MIQNVEHFLLVLWCLWLEHWLIERIALMLYVHNWKALKIHIVLDQINCLFLIILQASIVEFIWFQNYFQNSNKVVIKWLQIIGKNLLLLNLLLALQVWSLIMTWLLFSKYLMDLKIWHKFKILAEYVKLSVQKDWVKLSLKCLVQVSKIKLI